MEQWISNRLSECLGFPVPDEMIAYIMTLKGPHAIDDYFESLLDFKYPDHRLFLNDYKQRLFTFGRLINSEKTTSNEKVVAQKKNPLGLKPQNKKTEKSVKQKSPPVDDKLQVEPAAAASTGATKKKTKYVNLYTQDGQLRDVVLLKGRHHCDCQAAKHKLINNCLKCGRIVCEQEGSGPCLFCGSLVCNQEELSLIESSSKKGESLKKSLLQQQRPKGWEEAMALRNKLLDYDRSSEKRTTVIDDESDYFKSNSVWLSDSERKKLKRLEEELNAKKHSSRLNRTVTLDFGGRQIIEEPQLTIEFEDEILREIADSCAVNEQIARNMRQVNIQNGNIDADSHPLLDFAIPIFDDSVCPKNKPDANHPKYDGVYNRVQDKELLEISDLKSCMSMHQPWASLLVAGIKKHEGRNWYSSHRGRLWIAATAKPVDLEDVQRMEQFYKLLYNDKNIQFPTQYPAGCLLGCVLVQDCLPQEEYRKEFPNGESDSPFVFVCSNPDELPIYFPVKGEHKIYKLDQKIHMAAAKALQRIARIRSEEEKAD